MLARGSLLSPPFVVPASTNACALPPSNNKSPRFNHLRTICTNQRAKNPSIPFPPNRLLTLAKTTGDDVSSIAKFPSRISNPNLCRTEHPVKDANPEKRRDEGILSLATNLEPLTFRNLQRPFLFNHLRTPANWNFCVSPAFPSTCALLLENTGGGGANC